MREREESEEKLIWVPLLLWPCQQGSGAPWLWLFCHGLMSLSLELLSPKPCGDFGALWAWNNFLKACSLPRGRAQLRQCLASSKSHFLIYKGWGSDRIASKMPPACIVSELKKAKTRTFWNVSEFSRLGSQRQGRLWVHRLAMNMIWSCLKSTSKI